MSWRPAVRLPLALGIGIALLFIPGASPSASPGSAVVHHAQVNAYFLPVVRVEWEPPCGGIPYLVSPPDGSELTGAFQVVFDGGYRAGANDWLEVEVSSSPDFDNSIKRYFQPAGKRWEVDFWVYFYGTTKWYWRASVWCQGSGRDWPPAGYIQSHYSPTWSFTNKFYPYPPP